MKNNSYIFFTILFSTIILLMSGVPRTVVAFTESDVQYVKKILSSKKIEKDKLDSITRGFLTTIENQNISYKELSANTILETFLLSLKQTKATTLTKNTAAGESLTLPTSQTGTPTSTEIVNCFDYYSFNSVQTDLSPAVQKVASGVPIRFDGFVRNNNPYPIVQGALYVKIFRLRNNTEKNPNGPNVVDHFMVLDDIAVPAHESLPISFKWQVPEYAKTGEYQIATFFTTSKKFNLSGLSFTDDVTGNTANFSVLGEHASGVFFDKDSVVINKNKYYFAAFPPRIKKDASAHISVKIQNEINKIEIADIKWQLYRWDAQSRKNLISTKKQSVYINPKRTKEISITIEDNKNPVYLLIGTLEWKGVKSIINIRFVRDGVDRLRLNYPSITKYPLKKGEQNTLFSCLHNSGMSDIVPNSTLSLTLTDLNGNEIYSSEYNGNVTGSMMAIKNNFTPKKDYDSFILKARLAQGDIVVDEETITYNCDELSATECTKENRKSIHTILRYIIVENRLLNYALSGILLLLIFIGLSFLLKKMNRD